MGTQRDIDASRAMRTQQRKELGGVAIELMLSLRKLDRRPQLIQLDRQLRPSFFIDRNLLRFSVDQLEKFGAH
jgi:hypothetical protein